MKRNKLVFILAMILTGCITPALITQSVHVPAEFKVNDSTSTFLIIDAAEVSTTGLAIVKRREAVMEDVKADYISFVPALVSAHVPLRVIIDSTISNEQKNRILLHDRKFIDSLLSKHNAGMMAVLKNCYGGFEKDDVVTERNSDGSKSKTAYYSVFFESTWQVIDHRIDKEKIIIARNPHSSRPIVSGLLARGPGFKANRKDILEVARENAINFTGLFYDKDVMMQVPARQ